MKRTIMALGLALLMIGSSACATAPPTINQQNAAVTGAALGAGAGAIIGHQFGDGGRDTGALIGGVIGAMSGLDYGMRQDGMRGNNVQQGGDEFRNPYRVPDQRYCNGAWTWDPFTGYWLCR
jgi:uncharacterized protein YcfJ